MWLRPPAFTLERLGRPERPGTVVGGGTLQPRMDDRMRMNAGSRGTWGGLILGLGAWMVVGGGLVGAPPTASAGDDSVRLPDYFGFLPIEVYKLDNRIAGVITCELDGDKAEDIAVINNARSRIDLLLSGKKPSDEDGDAGDKKSKDVNEVVNDRRMRLVSLPVNKQVVSLQAGDFNGDGRADLVFFGLPSGLEIHLNKGNGKFGDVRKINVGDAIDTPGSLSVGDFDKDGRDDLALISKEEIVLIAQREKGKMSEPERLPHTLDNPRMVKLVDLDGDGTLDLVMLNGGAEDSIRARFNSGKGIFGPEERLAVESLRAYAFGNVDAKPGQELSIIEQQSGRTRVLSLGVNDEEDGKRGRASFYPLPPGNPQGRAIDVGDLDGDGQVEVVATDPSKARLFLYKKSGAAGLGTGKVFPSLVGAGPIRVADVDGDKKAEVYVLSEKEKQIGRSTYSNGRLSFPAPLPTEGEPVALEVADLDGDKKPEVVYVTRGKSDTSTADAFVLRSLALDAAGKFTRQPLKVDLKGVGGVPPRLVVTDVNRDGQPDVIVFNPFGPPILLVGRKGEPPAPPSGGLGPLADVKPAGLTVADLDGPSLLVAQQGFARKIRLGDDGQWSVLDQFDSGRPSSQIQGVAALDTDGDGVKEIALLDRPSKSVLFLAKKEGTYTPAGKVSVGTFDDFERTIVADFDGDGTEDLLLADSARFAVISTGQKGRKFTTIASYESNRNEAKFGDLAVGDLNADTRADVVLTDIAEHFIEIATFEANQPDLTLGAAFKVFEKKGSGRRNLGDLIEPRDMTLGDVDGDGRTDLILIVHDRVLVYRQDPGPEDPKAKAKAKNDEKPKTDAAAVKAAGGQ